jgi:uncharacterized protein (UPF0333 family)
MALEVTGKLVEVFPAQQVTEKFKKREFVIETEENYPQHVKLQLNQDKCGLIEDYKMGETLKVSFNLSGRPFTRKTGEKDYITNIVAWKIERVGANSASASAPAPVSFDVNANAGAEEDLPF